MYQMTAAHPTLPIPSYARVTNVKNGKSVVVRINDRGPFHSGRIIDLSYVAAYKLGYIQAGEATVEVESHRARLTCRMIRVLVFVALLVCFVARSAVPQPPSVVGKAWMVGDLTSGQVLAAQKRRRALRAGVAHQADDRLRRVRRAAREEAHARAAGQRVASAPGARPARACSSTRARPVTVDELIRGMMVQSGNDACIALAEAVAGSEEAFAQMMNREAARLGMKNTTFMNATGLPDAQHYSTARDLYLLAAR